MFLEAQFGADNVSPLEQPRLTPLPVDGNQKEGKAEDESDASMELSEDELENKHSLNLRRQMELDRLHRMGIPVPGVFVKVDKMEAKVWLEDLEVECNNRVFADRVRAVVERAVEVTAPLWG